MLTDGETSLDGIVLWLDAAECYAQCYLGTLKDWLFREVVCGICCFIYFFLPISAAWSCFDPGEAELVVEFQIFRVLAGEGFLMTNSSLNILLKHHGVCHHSCSGVPLVRHYSFSDLVCTAEVVLQVPAAEAEVLLIRCASWIVFFFPCFPEWLQYQEIPCKNECWHSLQTPCGSTKGAMVEASNTLFLFHLCLCPSFKRITHIFALTALEIWEQKQQHETNAML